MTWARWRERRSTLKTSSPRGFDTTREGAARIRRGSRRSLRGFAQKTKRKVTALNREANGDFHGYSTFGHGMPWCRNSASLVQWKNASAAVAGGQLSAR
jgi:hypothetical protein